MKLEASLISKIKEKFHASHVEDFAQIFLQKGFPTRKNEDWKYLDPTPYFKNINIEEKNDVTNLKNIFNQWKKENLSQKQYFVAFSGDTIFDCHLPPSIEYTHKSPAGNDIPLDSKKIDAMESLCMMMTSHTHQFHLKTKTKLENKIDYPLLFINLSDSFSHSIYSKVVELFLGKHSELTLIELNLNLVPNRTDTRGNQLQKLKINVADGAILHHTKIQFNDSSPFHYSNTHFHLLNDSFLKSTLIVMNPEVLREEINIDLDGPGAVAHAHGICNVKNNQISDVNVKMNHNASHTESIQVYKNLIAGKSQAIFNGKINIKKGVEKINSSQLNNNLLMTKNAQALTRPGLDIHADDVKASHGATVGQLSEEENFYLRSRGIPESHAKFLLIQAFVSHITEKVQDGWASDYIQKNIKADVEGP